MLPRVAAAAVFRQAGREILVALPPAAPLRGGHHLRGRVGALPWFDGFTLEGYPDGLRNTVPLEVRHEPEPRDGLRMVWRHWSVGLDWVGLG